MKNNILAIGAHPDDVELGCGGTLKKHIDNGDNVYTLILTPGDKGNHPLHGSEAISSLEKLGVKENVFLGFKDCCISDDYETISQLENFVRKIDPIIVYTHSYKDRHQDHRYCAKATQSAARFVDKLLMYESPSTTVDFTPHIFSDITNMLAFKIDCLKSYKTQIDKGIIDLELITSQARFWGRYIKQNSIDRRYAEAFEANHFVI